MDITVRLLTEIRPYRWKEYLQITEKAVLNGPQTGRLRKRPLKLAG